MKRLSLLLLILLAIPAAQAETDHWGPTPIANAVGGIAAGNINVYAQVPQVPFGTVGDQMHLSFLLTAPAATTPSITWTVTHQHGCTTSGAATTTTSSVALFMSSFDFDVTLADFHCSIEVRVQLQVGAASTTIYLQDMTTQVTTADYTCSSAAIAKDARACQTNLVTEWDRMVQVGTVALLFFLAFVASRFPGWTSKFLAPPLAIMGAVLALIAITGFSLQVFMVTACGLLAAAILILGAFELLANKKKGEMDL